MISKQLTNLMVIVQKFMIIIRLECLEIDFLNLCNKYWCLKIEVYRENICILIWSVVELEVPLSKYLLDSLLDGRLNCHLVCWWSFWSQHDVSLSADHVTHSLDKVSVSADSVLFSFKIIVISTQPILIPVDFVPVPTNIIVSAMDGVVLSILNDIVRAIEKVSIENLGVNQHSDNSKKSNFFHLWFGSVMERIKWK